MLKVEFDPRISLGSVLTIIGGIGVMLQITFSLSQKFSDYDKRIELTKSKIEEVSKDVGHVKEIQEINQNNFNEFRQEIASNLQAIDGKMDRVIQLRSR